MNNFKPSILEKLGWDKVYSITIDTKIGVISKGSYHLKPHNKYQLN